jgi:autophagy-related protein 2
LTSSNCARIAGGLSRTRAGGEKFVVEAVMPTLESVLSKPAIDGLQFLADDVSQLMARLHGPELAQLKTEVSSRDQSMIGSRFFARYGSRSGSVSNVASMPSTDASTSETVIKVEVAEGLSNALCA